MQQPMQDYAAALHALNDSEVRYVLIGGLAMIAHGCDHVTKDIDVSYSRDQANLVAVEEALKNLHPKLRVADGAVDFLWDVRTLKFGLNFTLITDIGPIDLLGEAPGVDSFEGLWERSTVLQLYGIPVHVASLDDLISMKRAANREQDRRHLNELMALRNSDHEDE